MRAVNLIPSDAGGRGRDGVRMPVSAAHAVLGALALAVAMSAVYVLTNNTIANRKAQITALNAQVAQAQAQAAKLGDYAQFVKLAQARADTVRQIVSSRFDWHAALSDLAHVVPADTSLQSLTATVAPGAGVAGSASSTGTSGTAVRSDIAAPAFELRGCTASQDDVARLMSRLRLINGVTRVTLEDTQKQDSSQGGATITPGAPGGSSSSGGCGGNAPTFDLVVFFTPLPGAAQSVGATGGAAAPAASSNSATTSSSATTSTTSSTTSSATTTSSSTTTPGGSR